MDTFLLPAAEGDGGQRLDRHPGFTRVRRGLYADAGAVASLERHERYVLDVRAVAAARSGAILARESALAMAGLPFGMPTLVYTLGDPSTPGRRAGVSHAHVAIDDGDVVVQDGIARCSTAYALADLARRGAQLDAVSAMDAALRSGAAHREEVEAALLRQGPRGRRRAEWVIAFADARAESPGESWSRVLMHRMGAPAPELQFRVSTVLGDRFLDFRWDLGRGRRPVAGEFDGFTKYGTTAGVSGAASMSGAAAAKAVFEEKRREDAIRATHDFGRWVWADLLRPGRFGRILSAAGVPIRSTLLPGW